jgi:lambda family phage portal protein
MRTIQLNGRNGHSTKRYPQGILLDYDGTPINGRSVLDAQATGYSNYGANLTKNALLGWMFRGGDADLDIGFNVQTLRERSRDAFMGIPLAAGAIETLDTNVVGEGLFPAPNVDAETLGLSPKQAAALNAELAEKFAWWAYDPRECDYEAKHAFPMLMHIVFQSMLLSGDCPVLFPLTQRRGTIFEFRLRVLEADRIIDPQTMPANANIFSGVELSDAGELQAYHVAKIHPLAAQSKSIRRVMMKGDTVRIEPYGRLTGRRNIVLLMRPERPEQRRGVPILAVCLELLKQMGRYTDATVIAAVIQSYFTAFIQSEFPDPTIFEDLLNDDQKKEITALDPYDVQLGPGIVNFMRPGHKVEFSEPTQPSANFGEFTISCAKFVGAATGIPYEVLLKQYNASYSASRAALLDFWKRVRKYRAQVIDQFCQPVYEEWLSDAISLGRIVNFKGGFDDPYIRRAMLRCNWTGSSAGSLDPLKEVGAADLKVKCGFSTTERESMELNGSNYRDNIRQQSLEQEEFTEADLIFPPYRPTAAGGGEGAGQTQPKPPSGGQPAATHQQQHTTRSRRRQHARARGRSKAVELASGTSGVFER